MKKHLSYLIIGASTCALLMAGGCGIGNKNNSTTAAKESMSTETGTTPTTSETINHTTQTNPPADTSTFDSMTGATTDIDPYFPLPDIDNPITDVEPNIPESGVGSDMPDMDNGIGNGNQDIDGSDHNNMGGMNEHGRSRRRSRDGNTFNPALPTK